MSGEVSGPSQKARDYAANIADECNPEFEFLPDMYRGGKLDGSPLAQAFARFEAEIRAETHPADADAVKCLIAAVDAWIKDPNPDGEQGIMDARAALIDIGLGGEKG